MCYLKTNFYRNDNGVDDNEIKKKEGKHDNYNEYNTEKTVMLA